MVYAFDDILSYVFSFIPFFYLLRYIFLLSLFLPRINGAKYIYENMIKPLFIKYGDHLETVVNPIEKRS